MGIFCGPLSLPLLCATPVLSRGPGAIAPGRIAASPLSAVLLSPPSREPGEVGAWGHASRGPRRGRRRNPALSRARVVAHEPIPARSGRPPSAPGVMRGSSGEAAAASFERMTLGEETGARTPRLPGPAARSPRGAGRRRRATSTRSSGRAGVGPRAPRVAARAVAEDARRWGGCGKGSTFLRCDPYSSSAWAVSLQIAYFPSPGLGQRVGSVFR